MTYTSPLARIGLVLSFAALLGACSDSPVGPAPERLPARLEVDPASVRLTSLGEPLTVVTRVLDRLGGSLTGVPLVFAVDAPSVLTLSNDGTLTAAGNGQARVIVSIEPSWWAARAGSAERPAAAFTVQVEQQAASLQFATTDSVATPPITNITLWAVGSSSTLPVRAVDARGNPVAMDLSMLQWSMDDNGVSVMDAFGRITAVGDGTTVLRASNGPVLGTLNVTVRATQAVRSCVRTGTDASTERCTSLDFLFRAP